MLRLALSLLLAVGLSAPPSAPTLFATLLSPVTVQVSWSSPGGLCLAQVRGSDAQTLSCAPSGAILRGPGQVQTGDRFELRAADQTVVASAPAPALCVACRAVLPVVAM